MPNPFRYTLAELRELPTITVGQTDDLKISTGLKRVWLSRMTKEDGMPFDNAVTVERYIDNLWCTIDYYEAK